MLISNEAFPLIGSVPPTCGPVDKADYLKRFFHKGRRCIAQLDAFTARCEKKYDGPGARWSELDYAMKIAIRDIRRKGVERCENYKYTRRDLLNRSVYPLLHEQYGELIPAVVSAPWAKTIGNRLKTVGCRGRLAHTATTPPAICKMSDCSLLRQSLATPPHPVRTR